MDVQLKEYIDKFNTHIVFNNILEHLSKITEKDILDKILEECENKKSVVYLCIKLVIHMKNYKDMNGKKVNETLNSIVNIKNELKNNLTANNVTIIDRLNNFKGLLEYYLYTNMICPLIYNYEINDEFMCKYNDITALYILSSMDSIIGTYGYKCSDVRKVYDILIKIMSKNIIDKYIRQEFIDKPYSENKKYFSEALLVSDIYINDKLFVELVKSSQRLLDQLWYSKSSYNMVKKVLYIKKLFFNIKNGNIKNIDNTQRIIILAYGLTNSDDRVFKLLLNIITEIDLENVIRSITNTPNKYYYRKLKLLSNKYDMKKYFNNLLYDFYPGPIDDSWKRLQVIIKYYGNNYNNIDVTKLSISQALMEGEKPVIYKYNWLMQNGPENLRKVLLDYYVNICANQFLPIYLMNISKINRAKIMKMLQYFIRYYTTFDNNLKLLKNFMCSIKDIHGAKLYEKFNDYNDFSYKLNIIGNFIPVNKNVYNYEFKLKINRIKSFLRIRTNSYIKNKYKNIEYNRALLLREIISFKPNEKYHVLSRGSRVHRILNQSYYQMKNPEMFNIHKIKNTNDNIISLKADGINEKRMNMITINRIKEQIKSEFIEDKLLYLVYDINIPNTTYIERLIHLRNIHPMNLIEIYEAETISEIYDIIRIESKNEKYWLEKNKGEYCWYPKAFIKYTGNLNELYKYVFNGKLKDSSLNYKIDGIIINNNGVDYKMKPKNEHTLDLEYKNGNFCSKTSIVNFTVVNKNNVELIDTNIYRCYPIDKNMYYVGELREDKYVANNDRIIEIIRDSYINNTKYYDNTNVIKDDDLLHVKNSRIITNKFIQSLNLDKNLSILDLGCGKGNILNVIPGHKKYILIDKYIENIKCKENPDTEIIRCDLDNDKLDEKILPDIKDSIWIILNSIWYFKDNMIDSIKKFLPENIILNVHTKDIFWKTSNSYMNLEGKQVKYYYNWCHDEEHCEDHVTIDDIYPELKKLGYKIVKKQSFEKRNNLLSNFETYYLKK